jgi:hypothetical protein
LVKAITQSLSKFHDPKAERIIFHLMVWKYLGQKNQKSDYENFYYSSTTLDFLMQIKV